MGRPRCSSARDRCVPMLCVPYPVPPARTERKGRETLRVLCLSDTYVV